jgi:hypothetical protein
LSVDARHHEIGDHEIEAAFGEQTEGFVRPVRRLDGEPERREDSLGEQQQIVVVVDDQDPPRRVEDHRWLPAAVVFWTSADIMADGLSDLPDER